MENKIYSSLLLEAIDEKQNVSISQFKKIDFNKNRSIMEVFALFSSLLNAVTVDPPEGYVKCVFVKLKDNLVTDIKYEYSDAPISSNEIGFIFDNDWTTALAKSDKNDN